MNFIEFLTGKTLEELSEENVQADIQGVQTRLGHVVKPQKPLKPKKTKKKKDKDPSPLDKTGKKLVDGQDSEDLEESYDFDFEIPENDLENFSELDQEELEDLTSEEFLFWLGQIFYKGSPELIDKACSELHFEFYDTEPDVQDEYETFTLSDLLYLVLELLEEGLDYDDILDLIEFEEVWSPLSDSEQNFIQDVVQNLFEDELDELDEAIKPRFTSKQHNKKRRKFMQKSKAQLNREKVKRRQQNRLNKQKRKQYYRKNKNKIKLYQKQYRKAVKKGTHRVKVRRNA